MKAQCIISNEHDMYYTYCFDFYLYWEIGEEVFIVILVHFDDGHHHY